MCQNRQRSLWKTLDWSYQLLGIPAQQLLAHLGVFQGGWTVEAAKAIALGEPDLREEMLERLEALANQSLIVYRPMEEDGAALEPFGRFSLLEIVQMFLLRIEQTDLFLLQTDSHRRYDVAECSKDHISVSRYK